MASTRKSTRTSAPSGARQGSIYKLDQRKPKPDLSQLASIGLDTRTGDVYDSTIRELRGPQAFKHYREMADHSPVIGACLFAIEMLLRKVKWSVEPGDESAEEEKRALLLEGMLDDMSHSWEDAIAEILSMMVYGFAFTETVYKLRKGPYERDSRYRSKFTDGLVGIRKFVLVPQETLDRWVWDQEGGIQSFIQRSPEDSKVRIIPIDKGLLFRTKVSKNNPQGRSMLLNAYYPWTFVKRIQEYEGIGIERDLAGMPYAGVPPEYLEADASENDRRFLSAVKEIVTGVRRNAQEGIVFPMAYDDENNPLFEFKLLATGGMRQFDTNKIIERYERRMAMSLLSDFILMGHERVGSLALSRDKTTLIGRALAGILASIAAVINRHEVPRLYRFNGWDPKAMSKFVPGDVENADIKNLGAYVKSVMSVGAMTPDPKLEAALREAAALPPIDPEYMRGPDEMRPVDEESDEDEDEDEDNKKPSGDDEDEDDPAPEPEPDDEKPKKPKKNSRKQLLKAVQAHRRAA